MMSTAPGAPIANAEDVSTFRDKSPVQGPDPQKTQRVSWEAIGDTIRQGEFAKAKQLIRDRLVEMPNDPVAISWLAKVEYESGNRNDAIELLRDVDIDTPVHGIPAAGLLATWLIETGEFEKSLVQLRAILSRMPREPLVHRQISQVLNLMGRRQEAAQHVRELCLLGNVTQNELASLMSLRLPFDTRDSDATVAADKQNEGVQWPTGLAQALELLKCGDARSALSLLRAGVNAINEDANSPRDPWMISLFGRTAVELNDNEAIAAWLDSLSPGVTRSADHWCALGLLAGRPDIGRTDEAIQFCEAALELDPTDWSSCGYLEGLITQVGDSGAAIRYHERALHIQNSLLASNRLATSDDELDVSATIQALVDALRKLDRDLEAALWAIIYSRKLGASAGELGDEFSLAEEVRSLQKKHVSVENQKSENQKSLILKDHKRLVSLAESFIDTLRGESFLHDSVTASNSTETIDSTIDVSIRWNTPADHFGLSFQYANADPPKRRDFQLYEQFGAGVASLDFDRDGLVDLYFPQASGTPNQTDSTRPNALFRQVDQRFEEVTQSAECDDRGYGLGVSVGDLNQDGWEDLLICNFGANVLLINQGDGTFRRRSLDPSPHTGWTSSMAVADFNSDSLPDFFEANYVSDPTLFDVPPRDVNGRYSVFKGPESYDAAVDRVFLANSDGGFHPIELETREAASPALGVVAGDFDEDNQVDIYVANDMRANHLWTRERGLFRELGQLRGCAFSRLGGAGASMGIATGDFDGNGRIDIHVTNFLNEPVHHFTQTDSGVFLDGVVGASLYNPTMPVLGFGAFGADIDNDCDDDLIVLNGHIEDLRFKGADFKMLPQCFVNSDGSFQALSPDQLGDFFATKSLGRGLSALDWNKDGRVDFVANHLDRPAVLVENATETPFSWLQLRLVGTLCERSSVGAAVTVQAGGRSVKKWLLSGSGYSSHDESILHFGLGNHDGAVDLSVHWPNGSVQNFRQVPARHRLLIVQGEDEVWKLDETR